MARMGHDSERAAMIYQHVARGADQLITNAIDAHVQGEQRRDDEDGSGGALVPAGLWRANGTEDQQRLSRANERTFQTGSDLGLNSWSG